jgi:hypothetical protein
MYRKLEIILTVSDYQIPNKPGRTVCRETVLTDQKEGAYAKYMLKVVYS